MIPALRLALAAIALAALALWLVQCAGRRILYPAPPTPNPELALGAGAQRIWLETPTSRCEAFHLPASSSPDRPAPLVIYAHGNGELIDYWIDQFEPLRAAGVSVLLVEYPGYGRSTGAPSEIAIRQAMVAGFDWAAAQPGVDRARIIGWGRSLGGGAICALSSERPLARLVLESTFTSVRAMARELFRLPSFLVADPFDNLAAVHAFGGPVLLLHGDRDQSIPLAHARALQAAAARAELHVLSCGHNDCVRPWEILEPFLLAH
jgi:fermentation-respiration switch protein FrsA (DUF1100 family)